MQSGRKLVKACSGCMYILVKKLKRLKVVLRCINTENFADIEKEDKRCLEKLKHCQDMLHSHPGNAEIADQEL